MWKEVSSVVLWPPGMKFCDKCENRALTRKFLYIDCLSYIV